MAEPIEKSYLYGGASLFIFGCGVQFDVTLATYALSVLIMTVLLFFCC